MTGIHYNIISSFFLMFKVYLKWGNGPNIVVWLNYACVYMSTSSRLNVNSCGTRCFYLPPNCSQRETGPRAFSVSNWSHAAVACTGEADVGGCYSSQPIESRGGRGPSYPRQPIGESSRERHARSPRARST